MTLKTCANNGRHETNGSVNNYDTQDMEGVVQRAVKFLHMAGIDVGNDTSSIPSSDALPLGCDGVVHIKAEPRNGTPIKVTTHTWQLCH